MELDEGAIGPNHLIRQDLPSRYLGASHPQSRALPIHEFLLLQVRNFAVFHITNIETHALDQEIEAGCEASRLSGGSTDRHLGRRLSTHSLRVS